MTSFKTCAHTHGQSGQSKSEGWNQKQTLKSKSKSCVPTHHTSTTWRVKASTWTILYSTLYSDPFFFFGGGGCFSLFNSILYYSQDIMLYNIKTSGARCLSSKPLHYFVWNFWQHCLPWKVGQHCLPLQYYITKRRRSLLHRKKLKKDGAKKACPCRVG